MIVQLTRFVLVVLGALVGLKVTELIDWTEQIGFPEYLVIFLFLILGSATGYVLGGIFGRELARAYEQLEDNLKELSPTDLALSATGLVVGLLVAMLASTPFRMISPKWLSFTATFVMFVLCAYMGVRIALLKRRDVRLPIPSLSGNGGTGSVKLLDTSAIIDGRFAEMRRAGFLDGTVRVPGFVVAELHALSDSADDVKRARGRRGLDLLAVLKEDDVEVFDADYPEIPDTDGKLLKLAKDTGGRIVTVDFNLSKVAEVNDVKVLNINTLAAAMRPAFLPGERLKVNVLREGKEAGQGVGYLEDGTMVVVQGGQDRIGTEVDSEVTSVLQTPAGRMIFTRLAPKAPELKEA